MTTDEVRSLLEAHGWRVASISDHEARATYSDSEVFLYRSISGWWAVSARNGRAGKPQRVGLYDEPERHVRALGDWLRDAIREAVAA